MRNARFLAIPVLVLFLAAAAAPVMAQTAFKVPFKFESGGKKLPAGDYLVSKTADGSILFKQVSTGKETALPVTGPAAPPEPAVAEARLIFDEVGAFEPSYTEYFTIYVVGEVWLSGTEGYVVHVTKGQHKNKIVTAEGPKK